MNLKVSIFWQKVMSAQFRLVLETETNIFWKLRTKSKMVQKGIQPSCQLHR